MNQIAIPDKKELDVRLAKAMKVIDKRLGQLSGDVNYVFKTNTNYKFSEFDHNSQNIHATTDLQMLVRMLSNAKALKRDYDAELERLALPIKPVQLLAGCRVDDWISDLEHRIKNVANGAIITALKKRKEDLTQFLSSEVKLFNILEETEKLLKP